MFSCHVHQIFEKGLYLLFSYIKRQCGILIQQFLFKKIHMPVYASCNSVSKILGGFQEPLEIPLPTLLNMLLLE